MTAPTAPAVMKTCTKCGETKPLDDFYPDKRARDERRSECKACKAAYNKANKEAIAAYQAAYRETNKETLAAYNAAYREANKEALAAQKAAYRKANKEALAARDAAYYEANKEAITARQAAYREANKEAIAAYREANKEVNRAKDAARRARYAARTDEEIAKRRAKLRKNGKKRCRKCRRELEFGEFSDDRCNPDGLRYTCRACDNRSLRTIAAPYWAAHGIDPDICGWCGDEAEHVDHIHPLALGGTDDPWNLLPACAPCNLRKNARPTHVWITEHVDPANEDAWLLDPRALDGAELVVFDWHVRPITGPAVAFAATA